MRRESQRPQPRTRGFTEVAQRLVAKSRQEVCHKGRQAKVPINCSAVQIVLPSSFHRRTALGNILTLDNGLWRWKRWWLSQLLERIWGVGINPKWFSGANGPGAERSGAKAETNRYERKTLEHFELWNRTMRVGKLSKRMSNHFGTVSENKVKTSC